MSRITRFAAVASLALAIGGVVPALMAAPAQATQMRDASDCVGFLTANQYPGDQFWEECQAASQGSWFVCTHELRNEGVDVDIANRACEYGAHTWTHAGMRPVR
jgi:hypothetical protein